MKKKFGRQKFNNSDCPKNLRSPLANFIMIFLSSLPSICAGWLFPDMFPLARQVRAATDHAINACGHLAGVELPTLANTEASIPALKERIAMTNSIASKARPRLDESPRALFLCVAPQQWVAAKF